MIGNHDYVRWIEPTHTLQAGHKLQDGFVNVQDGFEYLMAGSFKQKKN